MVGDHISYTKEELLDNFTFRLTTQDRFYDTIYFPISFIKKIFYKTDNKEYFDKWVKRILEDTVIHVENSEFKLSQISVLNFDDEGVKAEVQNKHYHVYTKHSNNKDKSPVETKELKRIALDHSKPMLAIMEELSSELVELQKITADIKLKLNKRKINRPVLADISKKLISEFYLDKVNIEQLKKDMDLIGKNKDLQLMCSVFNLQKKTS